MIDEDILNIARKAWKKKDYNAARDFYQQVAYGYNYFTEPEKEAFTKKCRFLPVKTLCIRRF